MQTRSISIVINNYNYGRYVRQCIVSALNQTVPCEVVVVDDGSTDDSLAVLAEFGDDIVVVRQGNGGQAAALNAGVAAASGDAVAFLDSDDTVTRDRVERLTDKFERDAGVDWVRHNMTLMSASGDVLRPAMYPVDRTTDPLKDVTSYGDTFGTTSGLCFSRGLWERIGPIPEGPYRYYADLYLLVAGAIVGNCGTVLDPLAFRREHDEQVTARRRPTRSHVQSLLRMRAQLAADAASLSARYNGPKILSDGAAWWQRKALLQAAALGRQDRWARLSAWAPYMSSLGRGPLPAPDKLAFALRDTSIAMTPRRYFEAAWWVTHDGRPVLNRATRVDESASTPVVVDS